MNEGDEATTLERRHIPATVGVVKDCHKIFPKNVPEGHIKLHRETINARGTTPDYHLEGLEASFIRKGPLTQILLIRKQRLRDVINHFLPIR